MPKQTPFVPSALTTILGEIDTTKAQLAADTPERQRLVMTAWIARARAAQERGHIAERHVHAVAQVLQALGQTWWPGIVPALSRSIRPQRVFQGTPERLGTWHAVAREAAERLRHVPRWADDAACEPRPFAPAAMFAAIDEALVALGGPLGEAACPSPESVDQASRRIDELRRTAAELRWLRGCVPGTAWGAAMGRLRGLARALGAEGGPIEEILDPTFVRSSWAQFLGRDPRREALLAEIPGPASDPERVLTWLLRAFDILDNPSLIPLCRQFQSQILALRPELAERRSRRRLRALQRRLVGVELPTRSEPQDSWMLRPSAQFAASIEKVRARFAGRRALFVSNRSFRELETRIHEELGLECETIASVGAARRRQALLRRIRGGAYDLVLVAHEFSGHADTEQFAEAWIPTNSGRAAWPAPATASGWPMAPAPTPATHGCPAWCCAWANC
ncbi:hypothetical protein SAMN02745121_08516 [Nannocystis exedens]|uniref:Uncharacterized protein n=1 Tax=Nannocystis exedens TaxID=54 RepID=A0A1I2IA32_9BACT|nr:hypothetical protein [Nannocystis exedens]PCC72976.1 hypothetical protein NAEX_06062 [Nannocystis exedens]SFF38490.1 hypothetical protein SAMN02745121_08516 [Nannocystis exedens]